MTDPIPTIVPTPAQAGIARRVGGRLIGPAGNVAFAGVELAQVAAENPVNQHQRQGQVVIDNAVGLGAFSGTMALGTAGAGLVGLTVGTGGTILIGVAAAAAAYYTVQGVRAGAGMIDNSLYGASDRMFQPNLQTRPHMTALASTHFRQELVNPQTGEIDWNNMETLNRYANLLTREIDRRGDQVRERSSYIPRWMRWGDGVVAEQGSISDLRIAESARRELREQMTLVRSQQIRQVQSQQLTEQEAITRINNLSRGHSGEPTMADLNGNGSNVLTQQDIRRIRETLQNDELTNSFLHILQQRGVTFSGQSLASIHNAPAAANAHGTVNPAGQTTTTPEDATDLGTAFSDVAGRVVEFFKSVFNNIMGLFNGSSNQPLQTIPPTGDQAAPTAGQPPVAPQQGLPLQPGGPQAPQLGGM